MILEYPFDLYRGDTYRRVFRLWMDPAKTEPVDLTGVNVAAEIRNRPGGSMIAELACTAVGHEITVEVSAAISRVIPTVGAWDLQLTYPSADVQTVVYGPVHVDSDVTLSAGSPGTPGSPGGPPEVPIVVLNPPTLTSITPSQGTQGTTVPVTMMGTNYVVDATAVNASGSGVIVNSVAVSSTLSLTANLVLDPFAAAGPRTLTVMTAAGSSPGQTFTIVALPPPGTPTLASVTPNQGLLGTAVGVTLAGTNFIVGATTVSVSGTGVTVTNVVVGSTTSLTATLVLDPGGAVGTRNVTVTTVGGTSAPQGFTISPQPPTLTSFSPNHGKRGTTVPVTVTGTNFVVGATTVNLIANSGITPTNVVVSSSTSLTVNFAISLGASAGGRPVTVTTTGGQSLALTFLIDLAPG